MVRGNSRVRAHAQTTRDIFTILVVRRRLRRAPRSLATTAMMDIGFVVIVPMHGEGKVRGITRGDIFCTIIFHFDVGIGQRDPGLDAQRPVDPAHPNTVILASSRLNAMPEIMGFPCFPSSYVISVPSPSWKEDSNAQRYICILPANSTERICSTLEPRLAISSISSKVMRAKTRAFGTRVDRLVIDAVHISIDLAFGRPPRRRIAEAVGNQSHRPSVVMLPNARQHPESPANHHNLPSARSLRHALAVDVLNARPCLKALSVRICTCVPV